MSGVLVVLESRHGALSRISLEALAAGRQLAKTLAIACSAAVLGEADGGIAALADGLGDLAKVFAVDHPLLRQYTADGYIHALEQLVKHAAPAYVLFPHTYRVRDYAPALATRFDQVLLSDVIQIAFPDHDAPIFVRQLLQGKLNADYRHRGTGPCFLSVQAGSFLADPLAAKPLEAGHAPIEVFAPTLTSARTIPGEPFRESAHTVDLAQAAIIVSVGRGIREQSNLPLVQALADALGAELAASRPICDAGWLPMERQVGSSGQTVSPKLYLAIGISGAIQHLVGIKGAKTVIAINKDPDAPIFELADYGIAADLFEIVPALTQAILAAKS
jgi:electron transfer flavoprotein alpha subunit